MQRNMDMEVFVLNDTRTILVECFGRGTSILFDIFEAYYKKNTSYGIGYMKACTKENVYSYKNEYFIFISAEEILIAINSLDSGELSEIKKSS